MQRLAPLARRVRLNAALAGARINPNSSVLRSTLAASGSRWYAASAAGGAADDSDAAFQPKRKSVPSGEGAIKELIDQQVKDNKVMVYMKGTPSAPQCGFSMNVVRILHDAGASFSSVNVLDYPEIREGIKAYSSWPTIPQVYIDGEFVGGSDIMTQLGQSGELKELLQEKGAL